MHGRLALAAALLVGGAPGTAAAEKWVEVRSPHFQVLGNSGAHDARQVALRLERFRAALGQIFPDQPMEDAATTTVLLFKSDRSFKPLYPEHQGKQVRVGGVFISGEDRHYMALSLEAGELAFHVVLHEYTHLLTSLLPFPLPLWVTEGMAEFYASAEMREDEVHLGQPLVPHVALLRESSLLPLETLFAVDHSSPHYNESSKQGIFYAQSWALVHYIMVERAAHGRTLRPFLEAVQAGKTGAEACRQAYGVEPAVLLKELLSYVKRPTFRYYKMRVRPIEPGALRERRLEEHEAAFHVGDALVRLRQMADARPFLEKALSLQPGFGPAYRSMGLGHLLAEDDAGALRWLDSAVERDPGDGYARLLRWRARLRSSGGAALGKEAAAAAREDMVVAVRALPGSAEAWTALTYLDAVLGRTDDEAVRALQQAIQLAPERPDSWARLVQVLVQRGQRAEARAVAARLRARAQTDEDRRYANALLVSTLDTPSEVSVEAGAPAATAAPRGPATVEVEGTLLRLECGRQSRLVFVVSSGGRTLRLHAASPTAVTIVQEGEQVQVDWTCGTALKVPVKARYLPVAGQPDAGALSRLTLLR